MTLVIALVWGQGVLVSADSRASSGLVFHEERKIKPIFFLKGGKELGLGIAGGAGDAVLVKQGFRVIELAFKSWFEKVGSREGRNPFADEVGDIVTGIESRLIARYRELRGVGIEPNASLLLASVTQDGKPRLYVFDDRGLAEPVHDNPGYALLGKGVITGGLLLLRLLDYRSGEAWEWDLGLLSAFIIDMVSEIDPTVSPFLGESYFIRYDEEEGVVLGPLKEEAYKEYKELVRKRKNLFKLLWNAMEKYGEDTVERKLKELVKSE
ncbi:MAG: hypothetical protein DRO09_02505 [Thermoprotei archaeon]|nr:MAG: hypothetical protein DRO09_02505 [Thermoprotei archaeon]